MNYQYDGHGGNCSVAANAIGHLTTVSAVNAAGTSFQSAYNCYDAFGRVTQNTQTVAGQPYSFSYLYNLAGGQTQMTYPSGRAVTTGYDGAGRPVSVTGALSGASTPYIPAVTSGTANVQYAPQGAISQINLHNGLSETTGYNARLQPTSIQLGSLLTLGYGYSATNNNGNVGSQTITSALTAGGTMTAQQVYGYDGANRLTSVAETVQSGLPNGVMAGNWSIAHGYDQYGNQWATTGLPMGPAMPTAQTQFNAPLNRLSARSTGAALPADAYDAAGNLQDHPDIGQMTYDAENRQLTYSNGGGQAASYDYDGEGRRVRKTTPAGTTVYVYDAAGELATEMDPPGSVTDTGTLYLTADHLGSTRAVTDASGTLKERWDYFPFGQTIPSGQVFGNRNLVAGYDTATGMTLEFTGKERDAETGLDYFGARYFSGAQGRFTGPDPTFLNILKVFNPQRWNLYSYAVNNPLHYVDPDGKEAIAVVYPNYSVQSRNSLPGVPLGHGGVVVVMPDGTTHYFEYGRYAGPDGLVRNAGASATATPSIERDASGDITPGSLNNLLETLSGSAGKGGQVDALVIQTTPEQDAAMYAYLLNREKQNDDPNREKYSLAGGHNCGTLTCDTLHAAGMSTVPQCACPLG